MLQFLNSWSVGTLFETEGGDVVKIVAVISDERFVGVNMIGNAETSIVQVYDVSGKLIGGCNSTDDLVREASRGKLAWDRLSCNERRGIVATVEEFRTRKITGLRLIRSWTDLGLGEAKSVFEDVAYGVEYTRSI